MDDRSFDEVFKAKLEAYRDVQPPSESNLAAVMGRVAGHAVAKPWYLAWKTYAVAASILLAGSAMAWVGNKIITQEQELARLEEKIQSLEAERSLPDQDPASLSSITPAETPAVAEAIPAPEPRPVAVEQTTSTSARQTRATQTFGQLAITRPTEAVEAPPSTVAEAEGMSAPAEAFLSESSLLPLKNQEVSRLAPSRFKDQVRMRKQQPLNLEEDPGAGIPAPSSGKTSFTFIEPRLGVQYTRRSPRRGKIGSTFALDHFGGRLETGLGGNWRVSVGVDNYAQLQRIENAEGKRPELAHLPGLPPMRPEHQLEKVLVASEIVEVPLHLRYQHNLKERLGVFLGAGASVIRMREQEFNYVELGPEPQSVSARMIDPYTYWGNWRAEVGVDLELNPYMHLQAGTTYARSIAPQGIDRNTQSGSNHYLTLLFNL
ncbi:MAG: hypothetical protein AAFR61_10170 [Bacteroidota bacterium]